MLLLLLTLSATFTFGFCIASRLSCAMGHFVIGKLTPGAEPRVLAVLATCVVVLVPANFIAAFIFHFAKAQPGAEQSECDLTRLSGWLQLVCQLTAAAVRFITPRCLLRRDNQAIRQSAGSINDSSDTASSPPSFSLLSIPRSILLLLTSLLSALFTAHTPVGLWARNGCLDVLSILLTLLPTYLLDAFNIHGYYTVSMQDFMERLLGQQWVPLVIWVVLTLNTTRTVVLLPLWYRNVPWRQQLSINGTPLLEPTKNAHCEQRAEELQEEAAVADKHPSGEVGCETESDESSLSTPPAQLFRASPFMLRCSSIADTASPCASPRSVLSDECDSASIASDDWQVEKASPMDDVDVRWLPPSHSFSFSVSSSSSSSSCSSSTARLTGARSVLWLYLMLIGTAWYVFLILSLALENDVVAVQPLSSYVEQLTTWTDTHPTLVLCTCFGSLLLFLIVDHIRHIRHSQHQQQAFLTADDCGCRTPYLLLLCVLVSLDAMYYTTLTPFSSIISQSYLAIDSSLHQRTLTVMSFYALMLLWQIIVRYVAMHALPRGSSLAVLFPVMLIEDVWADLIFTSFTPFSLSFFFISTLHTMKTFVRDFDLLPSILLYLPTLLASPSTASLRACLTQSSGWRLAFPRRVLRHQNLVTELCAKVVVVAVLCGDMVGESVVGPPMMLLDPSLPVDAVQWDEQRRQRGMIVAALVFLMILQCVVHAVVLRLLGWIDGMEHEDDKVAAEDVSVADIRPADDTSIPAADESTCAAPCDSCDVDRPAEAESTTFAQISCADDECRVPYQSADDRPSSWHHTTTSPLPRSFSSSTFSSSNAAISPSSSSDGSIIWLDRHWRFHFLFFVCCIVRLVSVVLSMISENLHNVIQDNARMCTYIPLMNNIGYHGDV